MRIEHKFLLNCFRKYYGYHPKLHGSSLRLHQSLQERRSGTSHAGLTRPVVLLFTSQDGFCFCLHVWLSADLQHVNNNQHSPCFMLLFSTRQARQQFDRINRIFISIKTVITNFIMYTSVCRL